MYLNPLNSSTFFALKKLELFGTNCKRKEKKGKKIEKPRKTEHQNIEVYVKLYLTIFCVSKLFSRMRSSYSGSRPKRSEFASTIIVDPG